MQHRAAFKMSAAINQGHAIPKRKRCSFPKLNARTFAHDPFPIGGMQENSRIESFSPLNHRRVKMRMRNGNGANAAARVHLRSEEHTSELQSRGHLVCRLLLE